MSQCRCHRTHSEERARQCATLLTSWRWRGGTSESSTRISHGEGLLGRATQGRVHLYRHAESCSAEVEINDS